MYDVACQGRVADIIMALEHKEKMHGFAGYLRLHIVGMRHVVIGLRPGRLDADEKQYAKDDGFMLHTIHED
jgi:hypothetical protein